MPAYNESRVSSDIKIEEESKIIMGNETPIKPELLNVDS